jgi:hypothetical protein
VIKSALVVLLVAACAAGCSQPAPPQSAVPGAAPAAAAQSPAGAPAPPAATASAAPVASQPPSNPVPTPAAEPPPPPAPTFQEVTIPAGTTLHVSVLSALASNTSHPEDVVKGSIAKPVVVSGTTALPTGTQLTGSVLSAEESGRVKGRAEIAFRFDRIVVNDETVRIQTATVHRQAAADTKSDVKKGGLGAGIGAVVGGVIGGGKGAAIGAVAGGAGTVMATKGSEVHIPAGTAVSVLLQDPLTVTVPIK